MCGASIKAVDTEFMLPFSRQHRSPTGKTVRSVPKARQASYSRPVLKTHSMQVLGVTECIKKLNSAEQVSTFPPTDIQLILGFIVQYPISKVTINKY